MKAVKVRAPGGIDRLELVDLPDPGQRGPGEILERLKASSLNYHDYLVVIGGIKTPDGRIPMSDGAGEVLAVGGGLPISGSVTRLCRCSSPTGPIAALSKAALRACRATARMGTRANW